MKKNMTISLEESTIEKINTYAKEMGISKSNAIAVMCDNMIVQRKSIDDISKLMEMVNAAKMENEPSKIV